MQTANNKILVPGPKSFALPIRVGTQSKLVYNSSTISGRHPCPSKPTDVKVSQETKNLAGDHSTFSIFRARSARSLFDHDSTDASDEEDDLRALRMASPICDSSDDDSEHSEIQLPTPENEQKMLVWSSSRLEEDDIKGFSLGGLILI